MEVTLNDLTIAAYQFILMGKSFYNKETETEFHFLPPIERPITLGHGDINILINGIGSGISNFRITFASSSFYLEANNQVYKIVDFQYGSHSFPTVLKLMDYSSKLLLFEILP